MKHLSWRKGLLFATMAMFLWPMAVTGKGKTKIKVMSYNMLFEYKAPEQTDRQWVNRLPNMIAGLKKSKPDVIGAQEIRSFQVRQLLKELGNYGWLGGDIGSGRQDKNGENEAIFYNKDRIEPIESGMIWFSETPEKPGTYAWGMKYPRACTWARLRVKKTGEEVYMLNSHFYVDGDKENARCNAARLLVKKMQEIGLDKPIVCTGDLNNRVTSPSIQILINEAGLRDSRALVKKPLGPDASYHGFSKNLVPGNRIDQILVSPAFEVKKYRIIDDQVRTGRYESDHLPVVAELKF